MSHELDRSTKIISTNNSFTLQPGEEKLSGRKDIVFSQYIDRPIVCGYLNYFSELEYSSENVEFLIAVDAFRENFTETSTATTETRDWHEIDTELGIFKRSNGRDRNEPITDELPYIGDETSWTFKSIPWVTAVDCIQKIFHLFISNAAPKQICMPSHVLKHFRKRLSYFHKYGKDIFEELIIDPWKTVKRDTIPRFLQSQVHVNMQNRLLQLSTLPTEEAFTVRQPRSSNIVLKYTCGEIKSLDVPLKDVIHDNFLYREFGNYLKGLYAVDNLYCLRALSVYHCLWVDFTKKLDKLGFPEGAEDAAWKVYFYFIAPGSVYEISISSPERKRIMQQLSRPTVDMFDMVEKLATDALKHHLITYYNTPLFLSLPNRIKAEYKKGTTCLPW